MFELLFKILKQSPLFENAKGSLSELAKLKTQAFARRWCEATVSVLAYHIMHILRTNILLLILKPFRH